MSGGGRRNRVEGGRRNRVEGGGVEGGIEWRGEE